MTKGWMKIKDEKDIQRALQKMLNHILSDADPLKHAGRFASLANSWINARRLELEAGEWKKAMDQLAELQEKIKHEEEYDRYHKY